MDEAHRISEWMRQNDYNPEWVAACIGFDPDVLKRALNNRTISHRLANALYEHFGLRVIADGALAARYRSKNGVLQAPQGESYHRIHLKSRAVDLEHYRTDRSSQEPGADET